MVNYCHGWLGDDDADFLLGAVGVVFILIRGASFVVVMNSRTITHIDVENICPLGRVFGCYDDDDVFIVLVIGEGDFVFVVADEPCSARQ